MNRSTKKRNERIKKYSPKNYNVFFSLTPKSRHKANVGKNYFYAYPKNSLIIEKGIHDYMYYEMRLDQELKDRKIVATMGELSAAAERIFKWFEKNERHKSVVVVYRTSNT